MIREPKINVWLVWLIFISLAIRGALAYFLELGNDEVYYWTYALYPDRSHFDHPPLVGWVIQLFTLDLLYQQEIFIRMGSLVFGALNTWIIYRTGSLIRGRLTGWYAALLYNASVYCFIITGVFILPDTPQVFFWLLSLMLLLENLPEVPDQQGKTRVMLAGLTIGLAMISKYTAAFLWLGAGAYILIHNRAWLKTGAIYTAGLLTLLVFIPVFRWNIANDFVSFTYHGSRVDFFSAGIRPTFFLTELAGQFLYNNPVNFVLAVLAISALFLKKAYIEKPYLRMILYTALPLIAVFLFISFFRRTLPHWTGPAYTTLILLSASFLAWLESQRKKARIFPPVLAGALTLIMAVVVAGALQVEKGVFYTGTEDEISHRGRNDISMDMYGWDQVSAAFRKVLEEDRREDTLGKTMPVFSYRWFPAANIDYYVAYPAGTYVLAVGTLERIHKYAWINRERGGFILGMDGYYITTSRDFADPVNTMGPYFTEIIPRDTVAIQRGGKTAAYGFIYYLKSMHSLPEDPLERK